MTIDSRSDLVVKKISRVYRYRFNIREALGKILTNSQIEGSGINNNAGGFQDFRNIVRKEAITQLIKSEKGRYEKLYRNLKYWRFEPSKTYLEDFIKLASEAKVKVIFVEMPITHLHNQMAQKSFYRKEYFEQLRRYLINYGIPLYNLSDMESDNHIPDTMHLSDEGATSFTQILFDKVIRPQI
ncbi:D-alanyl-lipoteichoic acid biosynthesis protein DltD [Nostoc sp.]|uniref:D-alanyl-lipoteichoic acid biosynthesis protein DltD n=1 Tax=Nostoc sp. TaxID=1180 RepID=UPI002FFD10AC